MKQLLDVCKENPGQYAAFYECGELFVNNTEGMTVFNRYMDWELAEELCEDLGITVTEV